MSTNLVRSLIAGSVSAVASITLFGTAFAHAAPASLAPRIAVTPAEHVQPEVCDPLVVTNLDVRVAQTSPDDWQWRFKVNGPTKYLCNDTVTVEMTDLATSAVVTHTFSLFDILDANDLGHDYVSTFATPCHYTTTAYLGAGMAQLDQYADIYKDDLCVPPAVFQPLNPHTDPKNPGTTVPGGNQLPHTGAASILVLGAALLVLGAGLGFTAVSLSRRQHHA